MVEENYFSKNEVAIKTLKSKMIILKINKSNNNFHI